jgi:hypothetical protein
MQYLGVNVTVEHAVWLNVRNQTSEPEFATFAGFYNHAGPKSPPNARFARQDKSLPYSKVNGAWTLALPTCPGSQVFTDPFEGQPPITGKICYVDRRTQTLWNVICVGCGTGFAAPAPKGVEAPPCPGCDPRAQAQPKVQKPRTAAQSKNSDRAKLAYAKRHVKQTGKQTGKQTSTDAELLRLWNAQQAERRKEKLAERVRRLESLTNTLKEKLCPPSPPSKKQSPESCADTT